MFSSFLSFFQRKTLLVSIIIILTLLCFSPLLQAGFLSYKDDQIITKNPSVLHLDAPHIRDIFRHRTQGIYMPLTTISFALEKQLFGLNPQVFHLNNLLLHVLTVGLLYYFLLCLGLEMRIVFLACLIFALHPSKVEAVGWASQRSQLLFSMFYLMALICYQKNNRKAFLFFGVLSFLSNWAAVSLLPVIFLINWLKGKGFAFKHILEQWPLIFMVGFWGIFSFKGFLGGITHPIESLLVWMWSLAFYIQKFFTPLVCLPVYLLPKPVTVSSFSYMLSVLISGVFFYACWALHSRKQVFFSLGFFLITVLFVLPFGISQESNTVVWDNLLYLPSVGLSLVLAIAIVHVYDFLKKEEKILQQLFMVAVTTLILGLGLLSYRQSHIWKNDVTLWKASASVSSHPVILNQLAQAIENSKEYPAALKNYQLYMDLIDKGATENEVVMDRIKQNEVGQVIDLYKKAIHQDPHYLESYNRLAKIYESVGKFQEALAWYQKALSVNDKAKWATFNLALLYEKMKQPLASVEAFNRLLKMYPDDEEIYMKTVNAYGEMIQDNPQENIYREQREQVLSEYELLSKRKKYSYLEYFNLGFLYEQVGGDEEARRFYKKSLELKPSYEKALLNLAKSYQQLGDFKTALLVYQQLVHYHPKNPDAYLNMGIIYNALGDTNRSKMLYLKAIDLSPNDAKPYFYLGYLAESAGQYKDALGYYERSLENDPKQAEAYYNMGNVYAVLGQEPEAMTAYLKTVVIDPSHQNANVNLSILSFKSRDFQGAIHYLEEAELLGYNPPAEYLKSLEPYRKR